MKHTELATIVAQTQINCPGLEVLVPGALSPKETATNLIDLLQSTYVAHAITHNPGKVVRDIEEGNLKTWLAKKDGQFVATASQVRQSNGDVEIGRAVSKSTGAGKLLMAKASLDHLENSDSPLVAEVRVAKEFGNIPSGEATQHICFEILGLVPHAIAPFFAHGKPIRNESFILARDDHKSSKTISEQALAPLNNRNMKGHPLGLKVIQSEPFRIAIPDQQGQSLEDFTLTHNLENRSGFTLFPIEVTDANMPLVGLLLGNPRMILCGVDHHQGNSKRPVVLFGTIGSATTIAPSRITNALAQPLRKDIQNIADQFTRLGDININMQDGPTDSQKRFMESAAPGSLY